MVSDGPNSESSDSAGSTCSTESDSAVELSKRRRANDSLAWARVEVLDLIDALLNATKDEDFAGVTDRLQRLTNAGEDSGRRLAVLLHMSTAMAAIVDLVETMGGEIDRADFANRLRPVLRACLHEPKLHGRHH